MEQQILTLVQNLREQVGGLRGQVRDLRTVLLGAGDDGETAFGRLPMVEKDVADHGKQITELKSDVTQLKAYKNNANAGGEWVAQLIKSIISGMIILLGTLLANYLLHQK